MSRAIAQKKVGGGAGGNKPKQPTSITRCLGYAGDRQIFNFTVSGAPGSTYPGRRHAAEALNGEAAKRPSKGSDDTLAASRLK